MQGWERKSVLRKTIGKTLPHSILNTPKKGFGIPLREWFKDASFDGFSNNNLIGVKKLLDKNGIERIVRENNSGKKDNGSFIWGLMMLNKFLNE